MDIVSYTGKYRHLKIKFDIKMLNSHFILSQRGPLKKFFFEILYFQILINTMLTKVLKRRTKSTKRKYIVIKYTIYEAHNSFSCKQC